MLFWAASEALTAVAFLLSTVRTLKALSPGRDYDGGRNQPGESVRMLGLREKNRQQ